MPDYRKLVIKITKKQQIQEEKLMDYKNSGVDIEAGYKSVELMKKYNMLVDWKAEQDEMKEILGCDTKRT